MDLLLLLSAADYLHIQPLIELCCARLARLLINKTPSEVIALMRISEENRTGSGTTIATTENSDKSSGEAPELQNQTQTQMSGRGRGRGRALRPQNITLTLTQDEIQQMLETFMWTTGAGSGNGSTATVNTGTAAWGPGDTATYVDVDYDSNDPQLDRSEAANEEEAEPAEMIAAMHEQRAAYLQEQQLRHFEHEHRNAPEGTAAIAIPSSVFKPVV